MTTRRMALIADDDRDIRDTLRFLLEVEEGYAVTEASDGAEVLAALQRIQEPLVVLLDQLMPKLTGMGVLHAIADDTELLARTRFVLFSARHEEFPPEEVALLQRLGVVRVRKPFEVEEVVAAVHEATNTVSH
jgi:CheY-like chemotaxis protein